MGFFDDLPSKASADEAALKEAQNLKQQSDRLEKAQSEADKKLAKAREEFEKKKESLQKTREDARKLENGEEPETEKPKEEKAVPPAEVPKVDVASEVKKALDIQKKETNDASVQALIRDAVKGSPDAKEEAEAIWSEYDRMGKVGDPRVDFARAMAAAKAVRETGQEFTGISVGSMGGSFSDMGGTSDRKNPGGISESQLKLAHEMGLKDEEIKKHGGHNVYTAGGIELQGQFKRVVDVINPERSTLI